MSRVNNKNRLRRPVRMNMNETTRHLCESVLRAIYEAAATLDGVDVADDREVEPGNERPRRKAAGCLIYARSTGRVLFGLRSSKVSEPRTWACFGGKVESDETPVEALKRELSEEISYYNIDEYMDVCVLTDPATNYTYYSYLVICNHEFDPNINYEFDDYRWVSIDVPPKPLHPGLSKAIPYFKKLVRELELEFERTHRVATL